MTELHLRVGTTGDDDGHDSAHPRLLGTGFIDYIYGDSGNDYISSGNDTDFLRGSVGNDEIHAGNGADYVDGGENNDRVFGDGGNDTLLGLSGNDTVDGGSGNDTISGGLGADVLTGGTGDDKFVFISRLDSQPGARDHITDFSISHDKLDFSSIGDFTYIGTGAFTAAGQVREGFENNHATIEVNTSGNSGAEMVIDLVGTGTLTTNNFVLSGGVTTDDANHNTLFPPTPDPNTADTRNGGGGEDYVFGGGGNDTLSGGGDNDVVRGGAGDDRVDGGFGDDALYGGDGKDTFVFSHGSDIVQDFVPNEDHIEVTSPSVHLFTQLSISGNASGSTVVVSDLGSMFVADVAPDHLHAADFVFK
jgi:Ca2+-binding RTX toxin-like protein